MPRATSPIRHDRHTEPIPQSVNSKAKVRLSRVFFTKPILTRLTTQSSTFLVKKKNPHLLAMAWYFNGQPKDEETHRGPGSSSLAAKREGGCHGHACDGSKICLSLNNTEVPSDISRSSFNTSTQTGGKRSVGVQSSAYGNMEEGRERRRALAIGREGEEDSSCARSPGSLTEYFSSLFDESFCSHQFKLVG